MVREEAWREGRCLLLTRISGPATGPGPLLHQGFFFSSAHHDAAPGIIYPTWVMCTTSAPEEQIQVAKLPMVIRLTRGRTKDWWEMECGKGVASMPWFSQGRPSKVLFTVVKYHTPVSWPGDEGRESPGTLSFPVWVLATTPSVTKVHASFLYCQPLLILWPQLKHFIKVHPQIFIPIFTFIHLKY